MPARPSALRAVLVVLTLTACVSAPAPRDEGMNPILAERAAQAPSGAYPDLSAIPAPAARPGAAALAADAAALEAEASALRALREEARRGPRPDTVLAERAAALRASLARDRAAIAAAPSIEVPSDLRRP